MSSSSDVTRDGIEDARPGRAAAPGTSTGPGGAGPPGRRKHRAEAQMVPDATFTSYYGQPILNQPTWKAPDIPGYLFLGGLAGAGSVIAAGAQLTGRPALARTLKSGCAAAAGLSLAALVHDLGRPARFLNMLRTFKATSPMSVGSWLLSAYAPAAATAALSDLTGIIPGVGATATAAAAVTGPGLACYTAALIANTAVPAWHDGYRYLPFVFGSSAVSAAAGLGLIGAPLAENKPVIRLAVMAGTAEILTGKVMETRMGLAGEAYKKGKAKRYGRIADVATAAGLLTAAVLARRSRAAAVTAGAALLIGSAMTRFSVFEAGLESAGDPRYTVVPQRQRLRERSQ
jgi:formate-dependent nitrite reductase membrane component NrfD